MEITRRQIWIVFAALTTLVLIPFISSKVIAASGLDDDVKLLLHGGGSSANVGVLLQDSSFSNHTVTLNGNAASVTDKFSQSGFFDGSGDYLALDGSSDFAFSTGDFTIDFWIRLNSVSGTQVLYDSRPVGTSGLYPTIYLSGTQLRYYTNSADRISGGTLSTGAWYHVAVIRSSGSTKMYIDGAQIGSTYTDANNYLNAASAPRLGVNGFDLAQSFVNGQIDEFRVSKGVARWTSNFTPPTSPYSSDANTSLLLHMDGTSGSTTFTDSSGSPKTVTANGDAKISSFSKFGGDGIIFDGTGDYLTTPSSSDWNFWNSSDNATIDAWVRTTSSSATGIVTRWTSASMGSGSWGLYIGINVTGRLEMWHRESSGTNQNPFIAGGSNLNDGNWHHVAYVKNGTSHRLFIDGAVVASTTESFTGASNTADLSIGRDIFSSGGFRYLNGNLDELRISNGTARWTSNFTPPTEAYGLGPAITLTGNVKFLRNIAVIGSLSKGAGTFVIDHPQKPRTHLLYHSFVESPEAKNIYDGIVELDSNGEATIPLPDYFEALNKDFRYQYFPIGASMPNLHVKEKVKNNQFVIAGGKPGGRVSWQVTGVRHDPYIEANPIRVEVEKGPGELVDKGECLHAEACP